MALTRMVTTWIAGGQALDLAEAMARRAAEGAPPPGVGRLPPRPRAAYDRLLDALNRLPRPVMVVGTLALIGAALVAPGWFEARMEALSRMPEALWWIVGGVMSLHFGARYQAHAQAHEREIVEVVAGTSAVPAPPEVPPGPATPAVAATGTDADLALRTLQTGPNPALDDWRAASATQP